MNDAAGPAASMLAPSRGRGRTTRVLVIAVLCGGGMIAARVRAGLTQQQLAERMHTTQAVIARLESGRVKPSTRTLERLAAATGLRLRISFEPTAAS